MAEDDHNEDSGLVGLKIFAILFFFALVWIALIPLKCPKVKQSVRCLSILNAFAGGVFLSMAFVHILPEAIESYTKWFKSSEKHDDHRLLWVESTGTQFMRHLATNVTNTTSSNITKNVTAAVKKAEEEHEGEKMFPFPYVMFFLGYAMVLFVDKIIGGSINHHDPMASMNS